jgi:ABC-type multidrug transport system fused ATPase/permease subunit
VRLLAQEALLLRGSLLANLTAFQFDSSMPLTNRAPSAAVAAVEAAATAAATAAAEAEAEAAAWSVLTSLGLFDRIQSLPNGLRCSVGTSDCL